MERLRILGLHGYRGSAQILRRQLAPLADGLNDLAEFVSIDAPSLAGGDFGWWRATAIEGAAAEADARVGMGVKRYQGWRTTVDAIVAAFARQGPFDGLFGFSQGAALAALLVGLRTRDGSPGSGAKSLAFDFAIMVGGFVSADADLARLYGERANYDLPSAHIMGRSDAIVPGEASSALASKFRNPLILEHDGGHVIANAPQIRQGLRTFLEQMRHARAI
ncbi:hypothetical protein [Methylocapsa sp. S129]|uniref:hypothetical protein n=1 Tax=Methylocapsa sp. S129 TaxID=1641869 RepID=UPI00131C3447|nr:hypothetical protein [Methylocapsa sp. S129]